MAVSSQRPPDNPAVDAASLLIRIGLGVLAFAVPLSAVGSRRALFSLLFVGAGLLIVAATLLPRPRFGRRFAVGARSVAGLGAFVIVVWSGASLIWTPFPLEAAQRWGKDIGTIAVVVVCCLFLPERTRTSDLYLFPLGLAAACAATIAVVALGGPQAIRLFQDADPTLERAVLGLVVLVWPALAALAVRDRWISAGLLAVGVTLASMAAWTSTALAALAMGALAFVAATFHPARVGRVLGLLVAVLFVTAPLLPFAAGPPSLALAKTFGDRVPDLGDAAETLRVWAGLTLAEPMRLLTGHGFDMVTRATVTGFLAPNAPRSVLFEIWYELGVLGAVSAALLVGGGFAAAGRASAVVAPFLLAELTTAFVIALWGMSTTQLWWVTLLGVGALAFATVIRGQYRTSRPPARVVKGAPSTKRAPAPVARR